MRDPIFACRGCPLTPVALTGHERLGHASTFDLDLIAPEPVDPAEVLGRPAALLLTSPFGERVVHGIVTRFVVVATAQSAPSRRYELTLRSAFDLLSLRRRSRVFQHLTVPAIIQKVLTDAGLAGDAFTMRLTGEHAERAYVTQYAETDAAFIRRLCEEEGLFFRFEAADGFDTFVLEDDSTQAPRALEAPLQLVDDTHLRHDAPAILRCEGIRRRRPGKVTLRDYDPAHPALALEGVAEAGKAEERAGEVYLAPGRFRTPDEGARRAKERLESLRAEARAFRFETNTVLLAPGMSCAIEPAPDYPGSARPEGDCFVVEVRHEWRKSTGRASIRVTAIPLDVRYRLPVETPKPRIAGVQSATISIKNALIVSAGTQTTLVGGMQSILIKATGKTSVGTEAVAVGGALLEQVGSPKDGAAAFAESAALAGVSEIPVVGPAMAKGYGLGKALGEAYAKGGEAGLKMALAQQAVSTVAEHIPAGDAITAAADGAGLTPWSPKAQAAAAAQEAGGGSGGPGAMGAGAAAAAPGHRKTIVDGVMGESIGGAYTVTTPGSIKWSTLGPSLFSIGGSHTTKAVKISRLTGGASSDTSASLSIETATTIGRGVTGALSTSIGGSLTSSAGGVHHIKAGGSVTLEVGGSMTAEGGSVVFMVGGSMVAAHGGGVRFKASTVTVNGKAVQSGKASVG